MHPSKLRKSERLQPGQLVEPWRPPTTGRANPNYGFVHFLSLGIDLPRGFSIEADWFLFNVFAHALPGCSVDGVPAADLCADGAALGDARNPAQRDSEWFLLEADWKPVSWGTIGVGLSTFQPVRHPDGGIANPFGARQRDKREREPFADYWYVPCLEEWQREGLHGPDILRQLRGIVSGAGAVGACDKDQQLGRSFIG